MAKAAAGSTSAAQTMTGRVLPHDITRELESSFLDYSMSVIVSRALPDARDGLKPVQRRILLTMRDEGLFPGRAYRKSATVVGAALGRYHPHGDSSVYEAMVRMAQGFAMHEPLVDGQGNFGSIDGDRAAAYRYTEARMTPLAAALLADLEKGTVRFEPTFDGQHEEAAVLPSRAPNLLLNGSEGIAVGMATKIPPHNLRELGRAIELLCEDPEVEEGRLAACIKGPDFPTGGVVLQSAELRQLYRTGRGKLTLRGTLHVERMPNGRQGIIVTEIPYALEKTKLVAAIAELVRDAAKLQPSAFAKGALPWHEWIADLRDESDREGIRIVIELKKGIEPAPVVKALYAKTSLQTTYGANLLALVNGAPTQLTLRRALEVFVGHRLEVIVRRAQFDLDEATQRAHVLEGLLIAIKAIDRVVDIIKKAKDGEAARSTLMATFRLSHVQAEAILQLRLRRLTALDVHELGEDLKTQRALIASLGRLLASPAEQRAMVRDETRALVEQFGRPRRTRIVSEALADEAVTETKEQVAALAISAKGIFRLVPADAPVPRKGNDPERFRVVLRTAEQAVMLTDRGRALTVGLHTLPPSVQTGTPLQGVVADAHPGERVLAVLGPGDFQSATLPSRNLVFVLSNGMVKRARLAEYQTIRGGVMQATTLLPEDRLLAVLLADDADEVFLANSGGKGIRFPVSDVPVQGRAARGVAGMKLGPDEALVSASLAPAAQAAQVLVVTPLGGGKVTPLVQFPLQGRGGQGVLLGRSSTTDALPCSAVVCTVLTDIVALVGSGFARLDVGTVPVTDRGATIPPDGLVQALGEKASAVTGLVVLLPPSPLAPTPAPTRGAAKGRGTPASRAATKGGGSGAGKAAAGRPAAGSTRSSGTRQRPAPRAAGAPKRGATKRR